MSVLYLRVYPCLRSLIRSSQEQFLFIALQYIKTTFPLFLESEKASVGVTIVIHRRRSFRGASAWTWWPSIAPPSTCAGPTTLFRSYSSLTAVLIILTNSSSYNTIGATYTVYLVETIYCNILVMGHTVHLGSLHSTVGADHTIHLGQIKVHCAPQVKSRHGAGYTLQLAQLLRIINTLGGDHTVYLR
jgi:hypothetical protein